jgi:hypothetical protein
MAAANFFHATRKLGIPRLISQLGIILQGVKQELRQFSTVLARQRLKFCP